jgi:hypothetical protein
LSEFILALEWSGYFGHFGQLLNSQGANHDQVSLRNL